MNLRLGKRYSSPFAWAVWVLLEFPAMLIAIFFQKIGRVFDWISRLQIRHVYYVFVRLARWVDGKPGWREVDSWIGVPPPGDRAPLEVPSSVESFFEESRARGQALLDRLPDIKAMTPAERCDLSNAIAALDPAAVVSAVPDSGKV